jgi:hypothetical protein
MTNTKLTLAQEIEILKNFSIEEIGDPYKEGDLLDVVNIAENNGAIAQAQNDLKIIKRLQEVIEVQSSALKSVTSMCHSDYEHHTITFNNAQIAHQALIKSKQLLEQ